MRSFRFLSILLLAIVFANVVTTAHAQCTPPVIPSAQPTNKFVAPGGSATLSVTPSGTAPFTYFWEKQLFEFTFQPIFGANESTYNTGPLTDTTSYRVTVVNDCGTAVSRLATVTVTTGCLPPEITTQPANKSINQGRTATLTVVVTGSSPTFQWYEGEKGVTTKPVGTNSENFTTPAIAATTKYWVRITNDCGAVDSEAATVTVNPPCPDGKLCALNGRFELTLDARDHRTNNTGSGFPLQQNDIFGFFSLPALTGDPNNPEVFVKMLDGTPVNGNYWVFFGGLTDLEYTLKVDDKVAGTSKSYFKEGGTSNGGFDVGNGVAPESCAGEIDGFAGGFEPTSVCTASSDRLCLSSARFKVTLLARDQRTDNIAQGVSIPQSDLFGFFALPGLTGNAENPEVFVKIVDGNPVNGFFWIFFSGLTDFEYTLSVVDTTTGQTKLYLKNPGSACGFFDTNAF